MPTFKYTTLLTRTVVFGFRATTCMHKKSCKILHYLHGKVTAKNSNECFLMAAVITAVIIVVIIVFVILITSGVFIAIIIVIAIIIIVMIINVIIIIVHCVSVVVQNPLIVRHASSNLCCFIAFLPAVYKISYTVKMCFGAKHKMRHVACTIFLKCLSFLTCSI